MFLSQKIQKNTLEIPKHDPSWVWHNNIVPQNKRNQNKPKYVRTFQLLTLATKAVYNVLAIESCQLTIFFFISNLEFWSKLELLVIQPISISRVA